MSRDHFIIRIVQAIRKGRHKGGMPIDLAEALDRARQVADALPALFKPEPPQ